MAITLIVVVALTVNYAFSSNHEPVPSVFSSPTALKTIIPGADCISSLKVTTTLPLFGLSTPLGVNSTIYGRMVSPPAW